MADESLDPRLIELERLLVRRYQASGSLLSADMFDRWGAPHASPEEIAQMADSAARASERHREASRELVARVLALRAGAPEIIEAWCDAHEQLLTEFIAAREGDPSQSTERYVAGQELEGWRRVRAGTADFVEENTFYVEFAKMRRSRRTASYARTTRERCS